MKSAKLNLTWGIGIALGLFSFPNAILAQNHQWSSNFESDLSEWRNPAYHWGQGNMTYLKESGIAGNILRVAVHQGGIDPATMRRRGLPESGTGFKARVIPEGATNATLSYLVRFPIGFPFVKGGKLPGLYGGRGNGGGHIPNGADGFSFRLMWLSGGKGQVYAYLPSSINYGTSILARRFAFRAGEWHRITEELVLNSPGQANGVVRLWLDATFVGEQNNLMIRTTETLTIDGIYFDYFFGGNDDTWAAPTETYTDFAEFKVRWK